MKYDKMCISPKGRCEAKVTDRVKPFSRIIVLGLKTILYVFIFAAFFLLLSTTNPPLLVMSRTAAITMSTFGVLGMILMSIYGGYQIGRQKSKTIIYAMSMATLLTDIVTYIQLQIMNTNDAKNEMIQLFGVDLALAGAALVIQLILIIAFAYLGNYIFFRLNPPERTIIITSSKEACSHVSAKVSRYRLQYDIQCTRDYRSPDLYVEIQKCDTVFIYEVPYKIRREIVEFCYKNEKNVNYQMDVMDVIEASMEQSLLDDVPFRSFSKMELGVDERIVKRAIDIVLSAAFLVAFSPLMLLAALLILVLDGRPIFYRQTRMTRGGEKFTIIKFRTMKLDPEHTPQISVYEDDERVTRSGWLLRRTRVDEVPQLLNVLRGSMSLVGPRPEMLENVDAYTRELPEFAYRLKVKAGLTGYAQISGKYNTTPKDKLIMDLMYIENYSLWQDFKLIIKTPVALLRSDSTEAFRPPTDDAEGDTLWFDPRKPSGKRSGAKINYRSKGDIAQ